MYLGATFLLVVLGTTCLWVGDHVQEVTWRTQVEHHAIVPYCLGSICAIMATITFLLQIGVWIGVIA